MTQYAGLNALKRFKDNLKVPTKLSQLDNDTGFIDSDDLTAHTGNTSVHLSSADRTKLNNLVTTDTANSTYATIVELNSHVNNGSVHVTSADKTTWNAKAEAVHSHEISDINGLRSELDALRDTGGIRSLTDAELQDILSWN